MKKVRFSKVYCGSWQPYMFEYNDHGYPMDLKFKTIKDVLKYVKHPELKPVKVDTGLVYQSIRYKENCAHLRN